MNNGPVRLNKFISDTGMCSRREADRYISQGNVFINGRRAAIGDQVKPGDRVRVNGMELEPRGQEDLVLIALNKPVGVTSTTEEGIRDNIVQFVNHSTRIFPIGRLDKDSQGLIFLTNNGDLVNKILRAGNKHEKEYIVTVDKPLTTEVIEGMARGVPMLGVMTKKCKVVQESPTTFRITLIQGLNRQIRRMCEYFGYAVLKLERIRIMNVSLKGLPVGEWRDLTPEESERILALTSESSSTENPKRTVQPTSKKNRVDSRPVRNNPDKRNRSKNSGSTRRNGPSRGRR
ncbi:MAG: hypothetical protein RIQ47_1575 [Bacteroidota bacterium]|jgi:23S rRNA pseudouridine2604 synthase